MTTTVAHNTYAFFALMDDAIPTISVSSSDVYSINQTVVKEVHKLHRGVATINGYIFGFKYLFGSNALKMAFL